MTGAYTEIEYWINVIIGNTMVLGSFKKYTRSGMLFKIENMSWKIKKTVPRGNIWDILQRINGYNEI